MRQIRSVFFFLVGAASFLRAQTAAPTPPPPQTARQALLEMFTGKGENAFTKHLPEATRQALMRKGDSPETSTLLRISMIGRQIAAQGEHLETFDVGPTLLATVPNEAQGNEKFEVIVEHDSLLGEADEIELSINYYKNGELQSLPVVPRLIFTFKQEKEQEKEIWKLIEATAAVHVPLTDPDYLKGLRKQQDESNEAAAQNRVTMLNMAEKGYATRHPDRGYTCTLATLSTPDPDATPGEVMYDPGQGNAEWSGYHFEIAGCDGSPAPKFRITAVPVDPDANTKMFCADESGTVKSLAGTNASTCFTRGEAANNGSAPPVNID
jgi:hypothetical protein